MSISRKSALISEEQLKDLVKNLDKETGDDEDFMNRLRTLKDQSKKGIQRKSLSLQNRVSILEKVDNWESDNEMTEGYEIARKRDSINEGRPEYND